MSTNTVDDSMLLSQRELLAEETLCDLLSEKTHAHSSSSSWGSYIPPSTVTQKVLARIDDVEHGRPTTNPPLTFESRNNILQSEDDEEIEESNSGSEVDDEGRMSSSHPSPPSSPMSSSFAQQITALNLQPQQPASPAKSFSSGLPSPFSSEPNTPIKQIPISPLKHHPQNSLPNTPTPILAFPPVIPSDNILPPLPFQTRLATQSNFFMPGERPNLRRSMSAETNQRNPNLLPTLPRKRLSSDSITGSNKQAHTSFTPHPVTSNHLNTSQPSSNLITNPPGTPQKNRQKKKRRRRDEIERKFTCALAECAKSYGSEGALKTHVKLKHPEMYIEQFSAWKGESGSPPPPNSSSSTSSLPQPPRNPQTLLDNNASNKLMTRVALTL